ncbi:MAG: hypothetical protein KUG60_01535, partial [Gammaproteobacteria bacterium]|nr:hypothetical protein [Gammaproteobacteria bacterium]
PADYKSAALPTELRQRITLKRMRDSRGSHQWKQPPQHIFLKISAVIYLPPPTHRQTPYFSAPIDLFPSLYN